MPWIWHTDTVSGRGDETIARCLRCGRFWAHNAGPDERYITRYCPPCLSRAHRNGATVIHPDDTEHDDRLRWMQG